MSDVEIGSDQEKLQGMCPHGNFPPCEICAGSSAVDVDEGVLGIKNVDDESDKEINVELLGEIFSGLHERLGGEMDALSDESLADLTSQVAKESGYEGEIFESSEERPKVLYRVFQNTEEIRTLVDKNEMTLRPFSYAAPGKWRQDKSPDLALAYGGGGSSTY